MERVDSRRKKTLRLHTQKNDATNDRMIEIITVRFVYTWVCVCVFVAVDNCYR